jgi:hypothetical protein
MGCLVEKIFFKGGTDKYNEVPTDLWSLSVDDIDGNNTKLYNFTKDKKAFIFVNVACK